ncbi:hypothetical protein AB0H49_34050 [Nocardia sp. NPDC050713]|uniref:hypothetical protein n=1 Tax=Nocardia sp. NPDC050713 TaxID=3154511 RepID=UPI0033D188AB
MTMNREIEQGMRRHASAWIQLQDAVAHGENEVEREHLLRRAEAIAQPWRDSAYRPEWLYLQNLLADWRRAPQVMQQLTEQALDGDIGDLDDVEVRSLLQVRHLADENERGVEGWQRTQDAICELQGRLAGGICETAVRESVRFRLRMLDDRSTWPPQWLQLQLQAERDPRHVARQHDIYEQARQAALDEGERIQLSEAV